VGNSQNVKRHAFVATKAFLKGRKPGFFVNLDHYFAPGSGSAFSVRIRIQDSQMNANADPQHWFKCGLYSLVSMNSFVQKSYRAKKSGVNKQAKLFRHGIFGLFSFILLSKKGHANLCKTTELFLTVVKIYSEPSTC
jgi:hypothetical protein